jgi:hypothetical protein
MPPASRARKLEYRFPTASAVGYEYTVRIRGLVAQYSREDQTREETKEYSYVNWIYCVGVAARSISGEGFSMCVTTSGQRKHAALPSC